MKKKIFLLSLILIASCSTPGRTCGGGKKRYGVVIKTSSQKIIQKNA